jgi:glycylpeptide N-tetradecanoyltransferase
MEKKDVPHVHTLLNDYLGKNSDLAPHFSPEEIEHYFLPLADVVSSFVATNDQGHVTDFISYYNLSSSVLGGVNLQKIDTVRAAYMFYYATKDDATLQTLVNDALIMSRDVRPYTRKG